MGPPADPDPTDLEMATLVLPHGLLLGPGVAATVGLPARHLVEELLRIAHRSVRRDDGDRATTSIQEGQGELVSVVARKRAGLDPPSRNLDRPRVVLPVRWRVQHPSDTAPLRRPQRHEQLELVTQPAVLGPPGAVGQPAIEDRSK